MRRHFAGLHRLAHTARFCAFSLLFACAALAMVSCATTNHVPAKHAKGSPFPDLNLTAHTVAQTVRTDYLLFLPKGYREAETKRWPLILFLHGIGECGTNVWNIIKHGPIQHAENHPDFPFILAIPQCLKGKKWSDEAVLGVLNKIVAEYQVNTNRVYLTGLSQAGFGVWSLATICPQCCSHGVYQWRWGRRGLYHHTVELEWRRIA